MKNQVQPFYFNSSEVRGLLMDDDPWFVAKDVCEVLGIEKYRDAVATLDDDERASILVDTLGGKQNMTAVSESGLYALVFKSRKPEARAFRKWVTAEVLPALRRRGSYETPQARSRISRSDVFHHRGPLSATGLDIRYTLDLTRIALRPCPATLAMVERLTGVDLSDISERIREEARLNHPTESLFEDFIAESTTPAPGVWVNASALYRAFLDWFHSRPRQDGRGAVPAPTHAALGRWLKRRFRSKRAVDGIFYADLRIVAGRA